MTMINGCGFPWFYGENGGFSTSHLPPIPPPGPTSMAMSFTMCRAMCRAMAIACGVSAVAAVVAMATMAAMAMVLSTKDGKYRWKMMEKYGT